MRELATAPRIRRFLEHLGRRATQPATVYLTGGATAVLTGWRESTIDIDLKLVPDDDDDLLHAIAELKRSLDINVELASPDLFIPVPDGWESRSPVEVIEGPLTVRHFDLVAQALSKLERGHERDLGDVAAMLDRRLVDPAALRGALDAIEPALYRYPAVDGPTLRRVVESFLAARAG